jgi:hypothetical protein
MQLQQPDSLRRVLDSVFRAPAYRWAQAKDPLAILRRWWAEFKEWLRALQETNPIGYRIFLYAMLAILIAIVLHALWVLYRTVGNPPPERHGSATVERTPRTVAWFRNEAERLATAGRYPEAIQADFLALVLTLDEWKLLRYHPSKTPAEYARESSLAPHAAAEFRDLVHRVYGYAFARWPCGAEEYARWKSQADPERYAAAH